jgi:hypothetical protein
VTFALQLLKQQLKEQKNGKSMLQNLALKYVIRNVRENKERLQWTVLLMSIYYGKTYKSSGQTYTLPESSKNTDIEMNAEKTKTKYSNTPHHAFLRRGSKAVGPMSQICGM